MVILSALFPLSGVWNTHQCCVNIFSNLRTEKLIIRFSSLLPQKIWPNKKKKKKKKCGAWNTCPSPDHVIPNPDFCYEVSFRLTRLNLIFFSILVDSLGHFQTLISIFWNLGSIPNGDFISIVSTLRGMKHPSENMTQSSLFPYK